MKRILTVGICFVFLFSSCEKDPLPETQVGSPAFQSTINFDGENYEFIAGENGTIMNPILDLELDTIRFNSAYTIASCPDCGPELRLIATAPSAVFISQVNNWIEEIGSWDFIASPNQSFLESRLNVEVNCGNSFSEGIWLLDGEALNPGAPLNAINFDVEEGTYILDFENEDETCLNNGPLTINFDGQEIPCYVSLSIDANEPNVITSVLSPSFNPAGTFYLWVLNGVALPPTADSEFVNLGQEDFELCVSAVDSGGECFASDCIQVPPAGVDCFTHLTISNTMLDSIITNPLSSAFTEIQFRNEEGTLFTSNNPSQSNASIELLQIEAYTEPSLGQEPFADATFEVQMDLYDSEGNSFPFSGIIQIALALPE